MILNEDYYRNLLTKFEDVKTLIPCDNNISRLNTEILLQFYINKQPIHINFQNSKEITFEIGRHLFIECANDIYLNHYDLPENYMTGDKLKRIRDNQYYEIVRAENGSFNLKQVLRGTKSEVYPALLSGVNYDHLAKYFVKIDAGKGISERTIKSYFNFFEKLNEEKSDFPKTAFEQKTVFIAKKPFWDCLKNRNKIPCAYLPNPREEKNATEIKSIPALQDCLAYITPKYEVCYQNFLSQGKKIKTIIVFDTEIDKIEQILQDKTRFGFNLIIISNSVSPVKNHSIPCWNWFKEEIEILNAL